MDFVSNPPLLIAGIVAFVIGLLLDNYASRYDFRGMILGSLFQIVLGRRTKDRPTEVEERINEIGSATTHMGKARKVTSNIIGGFLAPIVGLAALILILGGLALIGAAFWL